MEFLILLQKLVILYYIQFCIYFFLIEHEIEFFEAPF